MDHVLAVCAIQHADGAVHGFRGGILITGRNGQFGALHQRAAGGAVWTIDDSVALVGANSLASGLTVSQGTAFPNTWRVRDR